MAQLLQLQQYEARLSGQDAVVMAVFREEQFGLQETRRRVHADFVLALDLQAKETEPYGVGPPDFWTYLVPILKRVCQLNLLAWCFS